MPEKQYQRLIEPFVGSAAVTLAAARHDRFKSFLLGDCLEPLAKLWQTIIDEPSEIAGKYEVLWARERQRPIDAYYEIRAEFNIDRDPGKLLYLLARCVKNAVRFNPSGDFNQSPDKRRKGTHPKLMRSALYAAHLLLANRSTSVCADFLDLFDRAEVGDFFYLDPPYQGTSEGRDSRYVSGVSRERMIAGLEILNEKRVPFILSYDGYCGDKTYGEPLPASLASRLLLDVGRSSQATLNGSDHTTIESLYVSHDLLPASQSDVLLTLSDFKMQRTMAFA